MTRSKFYFLIVLLTVCLSNALCVYSDGNILSKEIRNLKPGINHYIYSYSNGRGGSKINVLEVNLSNENIAVKVGLPDKKALKVKEKLTDIVKREGAFAAINANYFDVSVGNPLGVLISDGDWLVGPIFSRAAIGFTENKEIFIDQIKASGVATAYRGIFKKKPYAMFDINGLNTPSHLYKGIGLYTDLWDKEFVLDEGKIGISIKRSKAKEIFLEPSKIPIIDYVLLGNKSEEIGLIKQKDKIKISWNTIPDWENISEAVSGGPYLVMGGEVYVDDKKERIRFSKNESYAPRSALGVGFNGRLYLITVDGNRRNGFPGLSLIELAEFLKRINLKEAINLDGGGSSTLVIDGKIINNSGSHHERKISSSLLVLCKE